MSGLFPGHQTLHSWLADSQGCQLMHVAAWTRLSCNLKCCACCICMVSLRLPASPGLRVIARRHYGCAAGVHLLGITGLAPSCSLCCNLNINPVSSQDYQELCAGMPQRLRLPTNGRADQRPAIVDVANAASHALIECFYLLCCCVSHAANVAIPALSRWYCYLQSPF